MVADRLTQAVRQQLGLGRLLPLGGSADGAWVTERAAGAALRRAGDRVPGVRVGALRVDLADPGAAEPPVVPPPPSGLPSGPLRVTAEFAAVAARPLPDMGELLRAALLTAAADRLGLLVEAVDLRVTELLDELPPPPSPQDPGPDAEPGPEPEPDFGLAAAAAAATRAVPGVAGLSPALSFPWPQAVRVEEVEEGNDGAVPHVLVEVAVATGHRAVDVARAVRSAVAAAAGEPVTVAVLVTDVDSG